MGFLVPIIFSPDNSTTARWAHAWPSIYMPYSLSHWQESRDRAILRYLLDPYIPAGISGWPLSWSTSVLPCRT